MEWNWQEIVALIVIFAGLGAGAFLVGQHPAFWVDLGTRVLMALWPFIIILFSRVGKYIALRNTPDVERMMQECVRRGGTWDNFNKKCKF